MTAGPVVHLTEDAGCYVPAAGMWVRLTAPIEASSVDLAAGRDRRTADWVLITGWQVTETGQHAGRRVVRLPVRRAGVRVPRAGGA